MKNGYQTRQGKLDQNKDTEVGADLTAKLFKEEEM